MFQDKNDETMKTAGEAAKASEEEVKAAGADEKVSEALDSQEMENQSEGGDASDADTAGKAADTGADSSEPENKKSSAKKDPKDEKIEELQDRLKRQMAEFDNYRKRTEKEKSAMYEVGARDIIEKILPVLDNFERGLAAVPEDVKDSSFAEGVTMIYKQFVKTLEDAGVETIEAQGKTFDPSLHNAVMHIEDEAYGENEISQELQKGYKYRGTVVRHSMVQVAN